MREGRLLEFGEIDKLAQICRLPMSDIETSAGVQSTVSTRRVVSLESLRRRAKAGPSEIKADLLTESAMNRNGKFRCYRLDDQIVIQGKNP